MSHQKAHPIGIFTVAEFNAFVDWDDGQLDWENRLAEYKEVSYIWTELFVQGQAPGSSPNRVLVITANEAWLPVLGHLLKQSRTAQTFYLTSRAHLVGSDNVLQSAIWRHIAPHRKQASAVLALPIAPVV